LSCSVNTKVAWYSSKTKKSLYLYLLWDKIQELLNIGYRNNEIISKKTFPTVLMYVFISFWMVHFHWFLKVGPTPKYFLQLEKICDILIPDCCPKCNIEYNEIQKKTYSRKYVKSNLNFIMGKNWIVQILMMQS